MVLLFTRNMKASCELMYVSHIEVTKKKKLILASLLPHPNDHEFNYHTDVDADQNFRFLKTLATIVTEWN